MALTGLVAGALALGSGSSVALAAPVSAPELSVKLESSSETVLSGGRLSYDVYVEASNLLDDPAVEPTITIPAPSGSGVTGFAAEVESPKIESTSGGEKQEDGTVTPLVITLKDLDPGTSLQFGVSWEIDNYTVLPGTVVSTDPSAEYRETEGGSAIPVEVEEPGDIVTQAKPKVNVSKTQVSPAPGTMLRPDDEVTYRLSACVPGDSEGQLNLKRVRFTDSLSNAESDQFNAKDAKIVDADGGVVEEQSDGWKISWDIDLTEAGAKPLGQLPVCGESPLTREITVQYPASMFPTDDGKGERENLVTNDLATIATAIDDSELPGSSKVTHSFTSSEEPPPGEYYPELFKNITKGQQSVGEPLMRIEDFLDAKPDTRDLSPASPVTKTDAETQYPWWFNMSWLKAEGSPVPQGLRWFGMADRLACVDSSAGTAKSPSSASIKDWFRNSYNFDEDGHIEALPIPSAELCSQPAYKIDQLYLFDNDSTAWERDRQRFAAIQVVYYDTETGEHGTTIKHFDEGLPSSNGDNPGGFITVYESAAGDGAPNLGLSDSQIITDYVMQWRDAPFGWDDFNPKMITIGTNTEAFADSGIETMFNRATTFMSQDTLDAPGDLPKTNQTHRNRFQDEDGNWQTVDSAKTAETSRDFVDEAIDLDIVKKPDAGADVSKLKLGDEVPWKLEANFSYSGPKKNLSPVVIDLLPVGLDYVSSDDWEGLPEGVGQPSLKVDSDWTNPETGATQTRLIWTFAKNGDEPVGGGALGSVRVITKVGFGAHEGSNSGDDAQYATMFVDGETITDGLTDEDEWDLNGNGDRTEHMAGSKSTWTVLSESGAHIEKFVSGSVGADNGVNEPIGDQGTWTKAGVSEASLDASGTWVDYRLQASNDGTRELKNVVIYDVLPYIGDTAISGMLEGDTRGSEFQVDFRELIGDLPAGVTAQFSTSNDSCRPELFPKGQGDCADDWSDELPKDPTTVRSLKFTIDALKQSQTVQIDYRGDVERFDFAKGKDQTCFADPVKYAVNNLAFQAERAGGKELLAAEAPAVTVRSICGEIGDYAWFDTDNDGVQDEDEKPAPGVTFRLVDADGNDVKDADGNFVETVTEADGKYSFNVPLGDWAVKVVEIPKDYQLTRANAGDDEAKDSDATALGVPTAPVSITKDHLVDPTLDAGLVGSVSVGDYVWFDDDEDGLQDEGEKGIADVTLELVGPDGKPVTDVFGNEVKPVVTDSEGKYSFDNLPVLKDDEQYKVVVKNPEGFVPTTPGAGDDRAKDSSTGEASSTGLTENGQRDDTLDFGFVPASPAIDIEKVDENGNDADTPEESVELPSGETGLEFTVTNGGNEDLVDVVVTDEVVSGSGTVENLSCVFPDGSKGASWAGPFEIGASFDCTAELTGVEPGTDHVDSSKVTGKGRWTGTPVDDEDPYEGHNPGRVSVGDFVWIDTDEDGVQDEGEPGIPGITLELVGPDGKPVTDVYGNEVKPVVTDEHGEYDFGDLPILPENQHYTVNITETPEGYAPTKPGVGDDRGADSSTDSAESTDLLKNGDRDDTLDFGFVPAKPVIDIEKIDGDGNDADTADESVVLPDGTAELRFIIENQGNEDLVDVTVSDEVLQGSGEVTDLVCVFPDGSTGTEWDGPFVIGESFDCSASLAGVETGSRHQDRATVDGKGKYSGIPVDDEDDYHGHNPGPAIDIEKYDTDGNDADTKKEVVRTESDHRDLVFTVTNTGDEALTDVVVSDELLEGGARVENLVCVFPDGSKGTTWDGRFEVGASFDCTAVVTGLVADDMHADNAKVTGTGVESGRHVGDDDPYHAIRVPGLAVTGASSGLIGLGAAGALLLAGGILLAIRRRRNEAV